MYANVLRAGTLDDSRVVERLTAYFVPAHFNNDDPTRGRFDPNQVLWLDILKQKDLQGQGLWIVAPDGKVLAGMSAEINGHPSERKGDGPGAPWQANRRFADAAVEMLDQVIKDHGPISRRDAKPQPLPFRGAGIKPDGGVRLIAYSKSDGGLAFSVPLSKEQWEAFTPNKTEVGEKWTLPDAVAQQFAPVLSPFADTRFRPRCCDLKSAELSATVEKGGGKQIQIRLKGRWRADWTHDNSEHSVGSATATGIAVFDVETKSVRSLLMIFDGTYGYTNPSVLIAKPRMVAAVVRWRLDGPAE